MNTEFTPTELSDFVVAMPREMRRIKRRINGHLEDVTEMCPTDDAFAELVKHMKGWLWNASHRHLPGFDEDDMRQEAMKVLWDCSISYKRGKGSFLNLATTSLDNRFVNLRNRSRRQTQPISTIECLSCGAKMLPVQMVRIRDCDSCGDRNWDIRRDPHNLRTLEAVWNGDSVTEAGARFAEQLTDHTPELEFEDVELRTAIEQSSPGIRTLVSKAMRTGKLTAAQRSQVRAAIFP